MAKKKVLLIVNPCAGQKKANRYLVNIINTFNRAKCEVITYITGKAGDGEDAAKHYASKVDLVACCGGDGTFNETMSGVLKSGVDIPIGYIPAGSTNDFATSMNISPKIMQATKDIIEGEPTLLDVGLFNERYFSYVASFGVFTKTSYTTPQDLKNALGHTAYVLEGLQELTQLKSHHLKFEFPDGQVIEDDFIFGAISNSTSVGGVLNLSTDRVDLHDGKLEVILFREPKNLKELTDCAKAIQKQTYDCSMMTFLATEQVRITAPDNLHWSLDGEREEGCTEINVTCLHHKLSVYQKR
ncbi:MAG: YegS/Rv2252/BmrU family lipid kinase [Lachnospiraceae bacterium]|nr:YegS/Rv2252/BmrU family lipid kinase [Lachnospiraceae bacterium]